MSPATYPLGPPLDYWQARNWFEMYSGVRVRRMCRCAFSNSLFQQYDTVQMIGWHCWDDERRNDDYFDVRPVLQRFVRAACDVWEWKPFDWDKATSNPSNVYHVLLADASEHPLIVDTDTGLACWRGALVPTEGLRRALSRGRTRAVAMRERVWCAAAPRG